MLHRHPIVLCGNKNLVLRELVQPVIINHGLVTDHACRNLERVVPSIDPLGVQPGKFVAGDGGIPVSDNCVEQLALVFVCVPCDSVDVIALQACCDLVQPVSKIGHR